MVFAGLTAIYVLFFNFSKDMNDPFDGVYQIKRSSAASYLLQIKWLVANQPWGKDIRFDTRAAFVPEFDGDVLEVAGENGMKSIGATMDKMENVEKAMTDAAIVSDAPNVEKKLPVIDVRDESVEYVVPSGEGHAMVKDSLKTSSVDVSTGSYDLAKPEVNKVDTSIPTEDDIDFDNSNGSSAPFTETILAQEALLAIKDPPVALTDNINMEPSTNTKSEANNQDLPNSTNKNASAKDFLPSYFRTLSGFSEEDSATDTPQVTVPSSQPKQPISSEQ